MTVGTQPTARRARAGAGAGTTTGCVALYPPDGCWYQAHILQTESGT